MPEILPAIRFPGLRIDSLGNYLACLGLIEVCSNKWPGLRGLWSEDQFVLGAPGLSSDAIFAFLLEEWRPTRYERWWKGSKEISKLRSWEPSLARVKILDAHIVAKGTSNVYNDILGTGGNVGKRDFSKVSEVCASYIRKPESKAWLDHCLFGSSGNGSTGTSLPDLPSTGTWFACANKAFNSGSSSAREGQLSPWSYLLALEGALLLRGGTSRRLSAKALRYATFPFTSEPAAPETEGQNEKERSEFWAPIWSNPADIVEIKALLRRGQARVGNRAARAPFDFATAAFSAQVQAGLDRFQRFSLRETTSANTYEAIYAGSATVTSSGSHNKGIVRIADWVDSLPSDKSLFAGIRAPVERALLRIAQAATPAAWKELLLIIGITLRRIDQNKNWRKSKVLSALPVDFFERAWPSGSITHEVELARSIASLEPQSYGLRHNIFGFSQALKPTFETFADPRPASAVWHDGDPVRRLADVLERRLLDAPLPPLRATQPCSVVALNAFAMGGVDAALLAELLPALSLIAWKRPEERTAPEPLPALSTEFLLQGLFRPLLTPRPICLRTDTDQIAPDATRARTLVKMIRGHMWAPAFSLAERVYRSAGIDVVLPPSEIPVSGDRIAACFLIPLEFSVIRKTFQRWTVQDKKGQL